uniref:Uncharacterized protein n=1 Tax=Moniliophthora roreri TaxID=221103 RepID=A0A0W0FFL9_MONRR
MSSISTLQGAQEVSVTSSDISNVGGDQINNQPQAYSATASITVQAVSPDGHPLANPWTLDPFPIPALYDPSMPGSLRYSLLLLLKGEGYPLWFPEPRPGVPSAYCATGVRIGDVGIVQSNKRFDYLFNICHRADDPINKYGVPDGFSTISYDEVELSFSAEDIYRKPGSPVTMPGSIKLEPITNGVGAGINQTYRFTSMDKQGAVLILPDGSWREEVANILLFREYAQEHSKKWFEYAKHKRKRDLGNGAILYLVTGYERCPSWGVSSFLNAGRAEPLSLLFTITPGASPAQHEYSWEHYNSNSCNARSSQTLNTPPPDGQRLCNSCVFMQGFVVSQSSVESDYFQIQDMDECYSKARDTNNYQPHFGYHNHNAHQQGSNQSGSSSSPNSVNSHGDHNLLSTNPVVACKDDIHISFFPENPTTFHPCNDIINPFMLATARQVGNASIAISHDRDWATLLRDDNEFPSQEELLLRLTEKFKFVMKDDIIYTEAVSDSTLERRHRDIHFSTSTELAAAGHVIFARVEVLSEQQLIHLQGNQLKVMINADIIKFNASQAVRNYTKYDEFQKVTLGSMFMMKSLGFRKLPKWDWEQQNGELVGQQRSSVQRTIYTTKIAGQQSKFTAIIYYGNDAQDSWEKDFQQFSHTHNPQLFGINQSAIPALIFHDELIPCAQFFTGSFWMNVYIQYLAKNMGCQLYQLWMNTTSGVLFSGPDGPDFPLSYSNPVKSIVVPATIDMLKDDVSFRFFSKFGSHMDNDILSCALCSYKFASLFLQMAQDQSKDADHPDWSLVMPHYLHGLSQNHPNHPLMNVIGGLQFNTVYSPSLETAVRRPQEAGSLWWKMDGLVDRTELNGGLTCFKLDPVQRRHIFLEAEYNWSRFHREWLSQSSWVFNALDVTEGKEKFFIVLLPKLSLQSTQHPPAIPTLCNAEHPVEETPPAPIYLFLHPLPTMISELVSWTERPCYFWSFDETGQSQMSEEECEQWGLPVLTFNIGHPSQVQLFSWPTHVYIALQDWQGARGFDPTTSDWARSMGYPEWEIIGTRAVDRFVLIEETSYKSETSDED